MEKSPAESKPLHDDERQHPRDEFPHLRVAHQRFAVNHDLNAHKGHAAREGKRNRLQEHEQMPPRAKHTSRGQQRQRRHAKPTE